VELSYLSRLYPELWGQSRTQLYKNLEWSSHPDSGPVLYPAADSHLAAGLGVHHSPDANRGSAGPVHSGDEQTSRGFFAESQRICPSGRCFGRA